MSAKWETFLERWAGAGLIDAATAARIRSFEAESEKKGGLRWPVWIALAFGAVLLGAAVLLFVAAHWDEMSPSWRFTLVLLLVTVFHLGGAAAAEKFEALSIALHTVGTCCLGAGIYLAGQIFNLQEHWPGGLMLWAAGAWVAWALLRHWTQAALAALFTPAWLAGEWLVATEGWHRPDLPLAQALFLLSVVYLTAQPAGVRSAERRALYFIGGLGLYPVTLFLYASATTPMLSYWGTARESSTALVIAGYALGFGLPLGLAFLLRGRAGLIHLFTIGWVVVMGLWPTTRGEPQLGLLLWGLAGAAGLVAIGEFEDRRSTIQLGLVWAVFAVGSLLFWAEDHKAPTVYLICVVAAVSGVGWGVRVSRKEGINAGILAFGITVLVFYFSTLMDKLERSASLAGLGVLFLAGGWGLERLRRRLVAGLEVKPK